MKPKMGYFKPYRGTLKGGFGMANKVFINDIKAGTKITFTDGTKGVVEDNVKGLIRTVRVKFMGNEEVRSCYAYEWATAEINGEICTVELTENQKARSGRIRGIMDNLG